MNRKTQFARIAKVNPRLALSLADHIQEPQKFDEVLFEIEDCGSEVTRFEGMRLWEVLNSIGDCEILDTVEWRASRHTTVMWLKIDGVSHRLWHWQHADNIEMGWEASLYVESAAVTAYEMAFYD